MFATALLLLKSSLALSLHLAGSASSFPKPLSPEEEQQYLARCAQGDLEARNILVERNMRLVAHIIKNRYPEGKVFMGGKRTSCVLGTEQSGEYLLESFPVNRKYLKQAIDFLPEMWYTKNVFCWIIMEEIVYGSARFCDRIDGRTAYGQRLAPDGAGHPLL